VERWKTLQPELLGPLRVPRHPLHMARFGLAAMRSAEGLARAHLSGARGRALLAGLAGHAVLPLDMPFSAAIALVLGATGHTVGWPFPRGGARRIAEALAGYLRSLGGEIETGRRVNSLRELPPSRAVLCDVGPRELVRIAGDALPPGFRRKLAAYRYGPGAFKIDWALDGPIPWRSEECLRAATVHVGGGMEEIAASERDAWEGRVAERPYVLLAQQSLFDPTRAPAGRHTGWAYCHVPNGCPADMTAAIERQVERFAPGFRDRILARHAMGPQALEAHNPNLVGGDVTGGAQIWPQLFTRPTWRTYGTPVAGLYLCSASTPPGGGVHGMCGYFAAKAALERCLG
jgi:phytoene dehydrogenase-like protein